MDFLLATKNRYLDTIPFFYLVSFQDEFIFHSIV